MWPRQGKYGSNSPIHGQTHPKPVGCPELFKLEGGSCEQERKTEIKRGKNVAFWKKIQKSLTFLIKLIPDD